MPYEYPPEYDGPDVCETCLKLVDAKQDPCECPECPECAAVGDLACQRDHGLQPSRPEYGLDAIRDIRGVAGHLGLGSEVDRIAKSLFKYTRCGVSFTHDVNGVTVTGYTEGTERECAPRRLEYPFTTSQWDEVVDAADQDGCDLWDETHGCGQCGTTDEVGSQYPDEIPVNPECRACGGDGEVR